MIGEPIRGVQQTSFNIQQTSVVAPVMCQTLLWISDNHTLFIKGLDLLTGIIYPPVKKLISIPACVMIAPPIRLLASWVPPSQNRHLPYLFV